ncbi:hypothetical protein A6R68_19949 [Neotoma lepida]|uniref:Uncharacterized protein n=1 Tax=Neotoma lepida TaxID=56216 RepID=A0A1A6HGF3_NEOLE|nr:hypothetical protein A6R68_19949 [Neotoma lepida]
MEIRTVPGTATFTSSHWTRR